MNKWQIICPVAAMLLFAVVGGSVHLRNEDRAIVAAIERDLSAICAALEEHREDGRLPSAQAASVILSDDAVAKKLHLTSLIHTKDILYNPSRPQIGSDAVVLGARVGQRLFAVRANHSVSQITDSVAAEAGLVPLFRFMGTPKAEPGSAANLSQPIRQETNQTSREPNSR